MGGTQNDSESFRAMSDQPTTSPFHLLKHAIPTVPAQAPESPQLFPAAEETFRFDNVHPNDRCMCMLSHKISDIELEGIIKRFKSRGVRLSSALLASLVTGLRPCLSDKVENCVGLECCVDLRRYLPDSKTGYLGNLFLCPSVCAPAPRDSDLHGSIENAQQIQRNLDEQLQDRHFMALLALDPKRLTENANKRCETVLHSDHHGRFWSTGLSNLGKVDVNDDTSLATSLQATEYWFATKGCRVGSFVTLCTASIPGHGMCISMNYCHPVCSHDTAKGILSRTLSALRGMV